MKFVSKATRGLALGAVAVGLTLGSADAQNGTNYHLLGNGFDTIAFGIGAGIGDPDGSLFPTTGTGTYSGDEWQATKDDGVGTWVPGEALHAATMTTAFGDWGTRIFGWRDWQCLLNVGANTTGFGLVINYPHISWYEHNSPNSNCPTCFSNPSCPTSNPTGLLLPSSQGYPSSCFALSLLPSAFAPTSLAVLFPDTSLGLSANPIYIMAAANNTYLNIPNGSTGFCWAVQFNWLPSALPLQDDIEGIWMYHQNSPDGNQYWGFSSDEVNLWNSNTWAGASDFDTSTGPQVGGTMDFVLTFPSNWDYATHLTIVEGVTSAAVIPAGFVGAGNSSFYSNPPNGAGVPGSIFDLNRAFDAGRGAQAISFSGLGGAMGPSGVGNQNPTNNPPPAVGSPGSVAPTLGFASWDNAYLQGRGRWTMGSVDVEGLSCLPNNTLTPDLTKGVIRLPVNSGFFIFGPSLTNAMIALFGHTTASGWPDPDGFPVGTFGIPPFGGHSIHLPAGPQPGACVGLPVNLTYGTVSLKANGKPDWKNQEGMASGSRELFLMN